MNAQVAANHDSAAWAYGSQDGGWWLFDRRTSDEVENQYQQIQRLSDIASTPSFTATASSLPSSIPPLEIRVAGHFYRMNVRALTQVRVDDPTRARPLRRFEKGCPLSPKHLLKGQAGLLFSTGS